MATGHALTRWFHKEKNIHAALRSAHEVDFIQEVDDEVRHAIFSRDGVTWRISVTKGENLLEAREIEAHVVDPTVEFDSDEEKETWETELGIDFHTEFMDIIDADSVSVECPHCDDFPVVAFDHDEAEIIAQHHKRTTNHTVAVDGDEFEAGA